MSWEKGIVVSNCLLDSDGVHILEDDLGVDPYFLADAGVDMG